MPVPHEHRAPLTSLVLPLACPIPECDSTQANVVVASKSVATVCCAKCHFTWSIDIRRLPQSVQDSIFHSA